RTFILAKYDTMLIQEPPCPATSARGATRRFEVPPPLVNPIGRMTLWSVTATLAFGVLTGLSSTLWLLTPLANEGWFLTAHRFFLASFLAGSTATFLVLFIPHRLLVPPRGTDCRPLQGARVCVALTAFNDDACIAAAVRDFKQHAGVDRVI